MFLFKGIKTIKVKDGEKNIRITGYTTNNEETIRNFLHNFSIVIMSFSEFKEQLQGKVYEFSIKNDDNENITIIIAMVEDNSTIRDAFKKFIDKFGIKNIEYVQPYGSNLDDNKKQIVINKLKEEFLGEENTSNKGQHIGKHSHDDVKISSSQFTELKASIDEFIKESKELIHNTKNIDPVNSVKLENYINELLKYKKTTNAFKLGSIYKEALEVADKMYDKYYNYLKEQEFKKNKNKIISDFDIIAEYKNFEKVQRIKTLEKIDSKEFAFPWYEVIFYKIFGKFGVNIKLIIKEFIKKYKLDYFGYQDILLFFQIITIFLIINYNLLLLYKILLTGSTVAQEIAIFVILFNIAWIGLILSIGKLVGKKSILVSIIVMIVMYILYIFLKYYFAI